MPVLSDWQQLLVDLSTGVWRLQKRTQTSAEVISPAIRRDLNALADRLVEAGIEILDHTGERFEPTKALSVLAFEPTSDADVDTISETIKPTIYYQGQWLQMGEVIVRGRSGVPKPEEHHDAGDN